MARYKDLKYGTTIDSTSIIDGSIETADIKDANITLNKLSATGTRSVSTFLSGNDTFETITIPPSAVSSIRHKTQTQSISAGSGAVSTVPVVNWTYTASGNETVKVTFNYNGFSTSSNEGAFTADLNYQQNGTPTTLVPTTTGTAIGPSFIVPDVNDISVTRGFLTTLTNGQTVTVSQTPSARIFGGGGQTGTWTMIGTMIVEVITASTF